MTDVMVAALSLEVARLPSRRTGSAQSTGRAAPRTRPAFSAAASSALFQKTLETALGAAAPSPSRVCAPYTVRRGDTLSQVCRAALERQGAAPSGAEVMAAVGRVAGANGLSSPDLIREGQRLDLSALGPARPAAGDAASGGSPPRGGGVPLAAPSAHVADIVRDLMSVQAAQKRLEPAATAASEPEPVRLLGRTAELTSAFGIRRSPFTRQCERHEGIDLSTPAGTRVYPLREGVVTFSGWQPGYGNVVIVGHDGAEETVYAHHSANLVRAGQSVGRGTVLGRVGSTGNSTGPHLHFELRRNGRAVNPAPYVADGSFQVAQAP